MVKIFNDHELELLISGLPEIDIEDLRANTEYAGYTAASQTIQWFWKVVREMSKQELALLVQFVTGTSKVPLEGFKALQVLFCHNWLLYSGIGVDIGLDPSLWRQNLPASLHTSVLV